MPEPPQTPGPAGMPGPAGKPREDAQGPKRWSAADMARIMTSYLIGLLLVLAFPVGLYHLVPDDAWERLQRRYEHWKDPPKHTDPGATSKGLGLPSPLLVKGVRRKPKGDGSVLFVAKSKEFRGPMDPMDDSPAYSKPSTSYSGDDGFKVFQTRVVRTRKKWRELRKMLKREDFPDLAEGRMALAVFAGRQPAGTTVRILSARPARGRLMVRYRITRPREADTRATHPYHVLLVPASRLTPAFTRSN